jgi:hypothetical protein
MTKFRSTGQRIPTARHQSSSSNPHSGYRGMNYQLNDLAHTKVICHALKYPHKTVNGLLLGHRHTSDALIEIVDAVPLQHHWTNLSPMMEVGLGMVRTSYSHLLIFTI